MFVFVVRAGCGYYGLGRALAAPVDKPEWVSREIPFGGIPAGDGDLGSIRWGQAWAEGTVLIRPLEHANSAALHRAQPGA